MPRDDGEPRTFSPWAVLAGLLALAVVGLVALVLVGGGESATEQLQSRQTTPTSTTSIPDTTAPVTAPGGAPVPEGVQDVLVDGPVTSYAFSVPPELSQVPIRAVVPVATARPTADGAALEVVVACSVGVGEALAQVTLTADASAVTVLPVTVGAADAPACTPAVPSRTVVLPLAEPIGSRAVVVVPAGTEVPTPVAR